MMSHGFNFAEPVASCDDSTDTNKHKSSEDNDSIQKSDFGLADGHLLQVIEVTYSKSGKTGHSRVYLIGIDIFADRRYEGVCLSKDVIKVSNVSKKAYLLVDIDKDGYVTLLNEDTCDTRSDIKLKQDSDIAQRLLGTFKEGNGQIKVTVLKALGEEKIMAFEMID
ncbi:unnamed protein product [Rotaria socialis]|uniref:Translation initiation factor 5A C-terminal domain-containing protein n=1 Tax=Rotaria socialis TaxID=392032 RepID=A0A818AUC8_9BILA|nr:unnamed protein product [Rotaria socialis]CAF4666273.1 unnamed protein product [Rotaria socialis]